MTKDEMLNKVAELNINVEVVRAGKMLSFYGFHTLGSRSNAIKATLESLGWEISPNSAIYRCDIVSAPSIKEQYDKMSPAQQRKATKAWLDIGGFADFIVCECGGTQKYVGDMKSPFGPCDKCGSTKQIWE